MRSLLSCSAGLLICLLPGIALGQQTELYWIDCTLPGDGSHAVVIRDGDELPINTVSYLIDGDRLLTRSDRVQLSMPSVRQYRIGANADIRVANYSCLEDGFGLYQDEGEVFSQPLQQTLLPPNHHIRSSCWASKVLSFMVQEASLVSYYYAIGPDIEVIEFEPECQVIDLFTVPSGMVATTVGDVFDPDFEIHFDPIPPEQSAYILETYGWDWSGGVASEAERWGTVKKRYYQWGSGGRPQTQH